MKRFRLIALVLGLTTPLFVFAQAAPMNELELYIARVFDGIIAPVVTVLFFLATAVMLFGLVEYLWKADSEEARSDGRKHMFWGIMGLAIMFSAVAIVRLVCNFFDNPCYTFLPFF